jgi:hypothetical protein
MERYKQSPNGKFLDDGGKSDRASPQTPPNVQGDSGKLWAQTVSEWRQELVDEADSQSYDYLETKKTPETGRKKKNPVRLSDIAPEIQNNSSAVPKNNSAPDKRNGNDDYKVDAGSPVGSSDVEPPKSIKRRPVPSPAKVEVFESKAPPAAPGPAAAPAPPASPKTPETAKPSRKNVIKFLKQRTNKREETKAEDWYRKR